MSVTLREIIPDGTQWGTKGELLSDWINLEFGQDLRSASAITFDYANEGSHRDKLRTGMYVVPEVNGNSQWSNSYFYIQELSGSSMPGTADAHTTKFGGFSLRKRLDGVRWMPAIGSEYMDSDAFQYPNHSPAAIIRTGVENYWSRAKKQYKDPVHWLNAVETIDEIDKYKVSEIVTPTTTINDMIMRYQDLGIATARFMGFNLQIASYDWFTEGALRDRTDEVQLKIGLNLIDAEHAESNTELFTALLVRGAADPFKETSSGVQSNAVQWVVAPQASIDKWGYVEEVLDAPDAASHQTLKSIGENYLRRHLEPRHSTTYAMVDNLRDNRTGDRLDVPNALSDFESGDSILILDGRGAQVEKVYAISLSYANPNQAPSISLTLNDFFDDYLTKFDQRLRRLGG